MRVGSHPEDQTRKTAVDDELAGWRRAWRERDQRLDGR